MESMEKMGVRIIKADGRGMMEDVVSLLKEFMENEARSGSMDFGCITPLYVYRMFGGQYSMDDIESGLTELRKIGFMNLG